MTARPVVPGSKFLLLLCGALLCCSCTYMHHRGNDLKDMFDGGVTSSEDAEFAFYLGFFNFLTFGFSRFDGTLHGLCSGTTGHFPAHQHGTGLLLWGHEELGYDHSNYPVTVDQPDAYSVGPLGLVLGPRPPFRQTLNCPKLFHFGWYGFTLNCHFTEFADFFLGWVGLDIYDDDEVAAPAEEAPAPATE